MQSINFDDGYEEFAINGDESRVIRFNPTDPEFINRLLDVKKEFENYEMPEGVELNPDGSPKSGLEKDAAYISEFTNAMRRAFNDIFNSDVYDTIFNGQSPLSGTKKGFLFENVLDALVETMKPAIEKYNKDNKKRMDKYLGDL